MTAVLPTDPATALAMTLDGEAGAESRDIKMAVASVILNRARNPRWWGQSVLGVCLRTLSEGIYQFSCWNPGPDRDRILAGPTDPECVEIAQLALAGALVDNTHNSDSYYDDSCAKPYWAQGHVPRATFTGRYHMMYFYGLELADAP